MAADRGERSELVVAVPTAPPPGGGGTRRNTTSPSGLDARGLQLAAFGSVQNRSD
jgi:hypothetical protein